MLARLLAISIIFFSALIIAAFGLMIKTEKKKIKDKFKWPKL